MNIQLHSRLRNSTAISSGHVHPLRKNDLLPVTRGKVLARKLSSDSDQIYYLYIPLSSKLGTPVFVAVHGIQRRANQHASFFSAFAEQYGCILIAPYFPKARFKRYQRLGIGSKGKRADRALNNIIAEVRELTGANTKKIYMFGYSGGAQFVSRYTMIYPDRVARIVLAAAGWYTYPDLLQDYPLGIKRIKGHQDLNFDLVKILSVPTCAMVGEKDIQRDKNLRKSQDIDRQQGINRRERSKRWIKAMRAAARTYNLKTPYDFRVLPESGHSFKECMQKGGMGALVLKFLFDLNSESIHIT